ncbi:MAG: transcription antitermination factor NusB [Candidatus Woodwardiibium sp.]
MTRRESREAAMCLLYEYSFNTHKTPGEILGGAAENREEKLSGFARELFTGACGRLPEIDAILAASAENWRLHRIARVPLAVLRLAVYELLTAGAENERIIINEALEICRTYADEKAVAFVNGVLGKAADAVGSARA